MALTGQLSDLSLAELIEFFCNQRKTGRLKVAYSPLPGIFYIKDGELVDARIGSLKGVEAVYYALRQPNVKFDFQPQREAPERTINEPWAQVVLEGLRRLDEGVPVGDPFAGLTEEEIERLREEYEETGETEFSAVAGEEGRRRALGVGVAAVAVLVCATAVGALTDWFGLKRTNAASVAPPPTVTPQPVSSPSPLAPPSETAEASPKEAQAAEPSRAEAVQRQHEKLERRQMERIARDTAQTSGETASAQKRVETSGGQTVIVRVFVDEQGRVSQATVANSRPGMEAYEASALRIARQRRYPSGKSGWVTVPIKFN